MIIDHIRNRELYYFLGDDFKKALDYFAEVKLGEDFEEADVKIPDSNAVVKLRPLSTKPLKECKFEAHRLYADIHFVACGKEQIGYTDIKKLHEISFDAQEDVAFYEGSGDLLTLEEGYFMITLPCDAHMPCICPDKPAPLGKMIAKIKL